MVVSQIQFRSISLPSRLHPINEFEAELQKLTALQISCVSKAVPVITSDTIQIGLLRLAELYNNSVQELAQFPSTLDRKLVETSLESSVELLDSCNTIRELVQMIKEHVQALQSALRRKGLDSRVQSDVASYFCFRKKMNKIIAKSLKTLNNLENKNGSNVEDEGLNKVLWEMTGLTVAIFKSILVFLSWSDGYKPCGWNLVSKLMLTKSVEQSVVTEVGLVDVALNTVRKSDFKVVGLQMVQKSLGNLDVCIEETEAGLERLFRQLVKSRVTLLNLLTKH